MNNKTAFFTLIVVSSIAALAGNFAILYFFRAENSTFLSMLAVFVVPALGYIIAAFAILGRNAACFDAPEFDAPHLEKIGAVPIKSIAITVVLQALFLGILIFALGGPLGAPPQVRGFLFGACLSLGMLAGTFGYVLGDSLVSKAMMSHKITRYPRNLREGRQSLKACIVPAAVAIITLMFTFSITALSLHKAGLDISQVSRSAWIADFTLLGVFFVVVAVLASVLKTNAGMLFGSVIEQLENISSEQKDLTRRIHIISVDELGTIAGMVNSFCENMSGGIREVKSGQSVLSSAGDGLEEDARVMAGSIKEISLAIAAIKEKTATQTRSVSESSEAASRIARNIESLNNSIDIQADSMSKASAAVEEMAGNITSIKNLTEKMSGLFATVNASAQEGLEVQRTSGERIREVVTQSESLQGANRVIATIAAQTNLLSMNAAIEAAHAGDAGRGFSVVADEIRKLAEDSAKESRKISAELKQIAGTIGGIVKSSDASAKAFSEVGGRVTETEKLVFQVSEAMREQDEGTAQVLSALRSMNGITAEVKTGSHEMKEGGEAILTEMTVLQRQAGEISASMEAVSAEIDTIRAEAGNVSELAGGAKSTIEKMETVVNSFTV